MSLLSILPMGSSNLWHRLGEEEMLLHIKKYSCQGVLLREVTEVIMIAVLWGVSESSPNQVKFCSGQHSTAVAPCVMPGNLFEWAHFCDSQTILKIFAVKFWCNFNWPFSSYFKNQEFPANYHCSACVSL